MFEQIKLFKWLRETAAKNAVRIDMATSGIPSVTAADLELDAAKLPIYDGANSPKHFPQLRKMLADRYDIPVEMVMLTPAASGANFMVPASLIRPGDEALSEQPYYEPQWRSAQAAGAKVNFFRRRPGNKFRIEPEEVERAITPATRLIILSNLHNPSMQQANAEDIIAVAEIAARNDAYVLIDEVYRESLFDRIPDTAAKLRDNIIVTSSFGKALGVQGLRIGWGLGPPEIIRAAQRILEYMSVVLPSPTAHILIRALEREDTLRARATEFIAGKVDIARRWAEGRGDIEFFEPAAGATVFVGLPEGTDSMAFCNRLVEERGVMVDPGELFGIPGFARISLIENPDKIEEGLKEIDAMLDARPRTEKQ